LILDTTPRSGVPDAKQSISVKHISGGTSFIGLKSYDQKRKSFQGTSKHFIWLDEEPPMDVYSECLIRTMTTDGLIMLTFTPLLGISEVVKAFLPNGKLPY
jgi:phage terminase large subunit-like protein